MEEILTVVSAVSIQAYIFRSNRLRDNIGASDLVSKAFEGLGGEVVINGGGQAVRIYNDHAAAVAAVTAWSTQQIRRGLDIRFVAAHAEVRGGHYGRTFDSLKRTLAERENEPPWGSPLQALPVTRTCNASGLAATSFDRVREEWISQEIQARRQATKDVDLKLAVELEDLGIREGSSQVALVHADGNRFGQLFRDLPATRHEFKKQLSELSGRVQKVIDDSFAYVRQVIEKALPAWVKARSIYENDKLPIRQILLSGDEATWVCHGRLGLLSARLFLEEFERLSAQQLPGKQTACAGVLIMPLKFPFSRAYKYVEELTKFAKTQHRDRQGGSWFDAHVIMEGNANSILETRQHSYRRPDSDKLLTEFRPWSLEAWRNFESDYRHFQEHDWPRSRLKELLQRMPQGDLAVRELLGQFAQRGYRLPEEGDVMSYFDVLELMDFHLLEEPHHARTED